jgi:hypothetical protein
MKFKMIAFMLALTMMSWAQTATQSKPNPATSQTAMSTEQADSKPECPCCQKTGEDKQAMACCGHHDMASKDGEKAMSCCGKDAKACMEGKEGKSCMKDDKSQAASCSGGGCCGANHEKCCSKSEKEGEKTAASCCGQCGKHQHDHSAAAGN